MKMKKCTRSYHSFPFKSSRTVEDVKIRTRQAEMLTCWRSRRRRRGRYCGWPQEGLVRGTVAGDNLGGVVTQDMLVKSSTLFPGGI